MGVFGLTSFQQSFSYLTTIHQTHYPDSGGSVSIQYPPEPIVFGFTRAGFEHVDPCAQALPTATAGAR